MVTFVFVGATTPGPNNIMVTASGANFGYWRTLPHMLGITVGITVMVLAIGIGLGQIFHLVPVLQDVLRLAGSVYMLYLAWKIATAVAVSETKAKARPFTFTEAALFQWVNPKAWTVTVALLSTFTVADDGYFGQATVIAGVVFAISIFAVTIWCLMGKMIGQLLKSKAALRAFNWTMAALLLMSIGMLYV